jgi:hypothetical protein
VLELNQFNGILKKVNSIVSYNLTLVVLADIRPSDIECRNNTEVCIGGKQRKECSAF